MRYLTFVRFDTSTTLSFSLRQLSDKPLPRDLDQVSSLEIYDLKPGVEYELLRNIVDFHGRSFSAGLRLVFRERHFLPYEDGHTVVFDQVQGSTSGSVGKISIYLQGSEHREIVGNAEIYFRALMPDT